MAEAGAGGVYTEKAEAVIRLLRREARPYVKRKSFLEQVDPFLYGSGRRTADVFCSRAFMVNLKA